MQSETKLSLRWKGAALFLAALLFCAAAFVLPTQAHANDLVAADLQGGIAVQDDDGDSSRYWMEFSWDGNESGNAVAWDRNGNVAQVPSVTVTQAWYNAELGYTETQVLDPSNYKLQIGVEAEGVFTEQSPTQAGTYMVRAVDAADSSKVIYSETFTLVDTHDLTNASISAELLFATGEALTPKVTLAVMSVPVPEGAYTLEYSTQESPSNPVTPTQPGIYDVKATATGSDYFGCASGKLLVLDGEAAIAPNDIGISSQNTGSYPCGNYELDYAVVYNFNSGGSIYQAIVPSEYYTVTYAAREWDYELQQEVYGAETAVKPSAPGSYTLFVKGVEGGKFAQLNYSDDFSLYEVVDLAGDNCFINGLQDISWNDGNPREPEIRVEYDSAYGSDNGPIPLEKGDDFTVVYEKKASSGDSWSALEDGAYPTEIGEYRAVLTGVSGHCTGTRTTSSFAVRNATDLYWLKASFYDDNGDSLHDPTVLASEVENLQKKLVVEYSTDPAPDEGYYYDDSDVNYTKLTSGYKVDLVQSHDNGRYAECAESNYANLAPGSYAFKVTLTGPFIGTCYESFEVVSPKSISTYKVAPLFVAENTAVVPVVTLILHDGTSLVSNSAGGAFAIGNYERAIYDEDSWSYEYEPVGDAGIRQPGSYRATITGNGSDCVATDYYVYFEARSPITISSTNTSFETSYTLNDLDNPTPVKLIGCYDDDLDIVQDEQFTATVYKLDENGQASATPTDSVVEPGKYVATLSTLEGSSVTVAPDFTVEFTVYAANDLTSAEIYQSEPYYVDSMNDETTPAFKVLLNGKSVSAEAYTISFVPDGDDESAAFSGPLKGYGAWDVTATAIEGKGYIGAATGSVTVDHSFGLQYIDVDEYGYPCTGKPVSIAASVWDKRGRSVPKSEYTLAYYAWEKFTQNGKTNYRYTRLDSAPVKPGLYYVAAVAKTSSKYSGETENWAHFEITGSMPAPAPVRSQASTPQPGIADGATAVVSGATYQVGSNAASTVMLSKAPKSKKSFTVPAMVNIAGKWYLVTGILPNAFKGTKAKTVTVKSAVLTKGSVKGCFKGSKVKTVKVKVGNKKANKKAVKKYKKFFSKKNCGAKVTVK